MNEIILSGTKASEPVFDHEIFGEKFYTFFMNVERQSGYVDVLPITVSEYLLPKIADKLTVLGNVRTFNKHEGEKNHLIISVFAKDITEYQGVDENHFYCDGYICKEPAFRVTPLGRKITDLLIAINRAYGKSDYIPSICWGRLAGFMSYRQVGDGFHFEGRLQSRKYTKDDEIKVAYEFSIMKVEELNE